jgi:hypothetical protein
MTKDNLNLIVCKQKNHKLMREKSTKTLFKLHQFNITNLSIPIADTKINYGIV